MQITQLDALTFVGPQISVADLDDLERFNVKTIVVARPEGETPDQPALIDLRNAAETLGITIHQIPVVPGNISDADVRAFGAITSEAGHPVFAYCRSGLRAISLWALNAAKQGQSRSEILRMAQGAGFDLTAVAPRLSKNAA